MKIFRVRKIDSIAGHQDHEGFIESDVVKLKVPARWKNYGTPEQELPAGTEVRLVSWRPEGFNAQVEKTGEHFFIFSRFLKGAKLVKKSWLRDRENY